MFRTHTILGLLALSIATCGAAEDWRSMPNADLYAWLQDSLGRFRSDTMERLLGVPDSERSGASLVPKIKGDVFIYRLSGARALWVSADHEAGATKEFHWLKAQLVERREDATHRIAWTVQRESQEEVERAEGAHRERERRIRQLRSELEKLRREIGVPPAEAPLQEADPAEQPTEANKSE